MATPTPAGGFYSPPKQPKRQKSYKGVEPTPQTFQVGNQQVSREEFNSYKAQAGFDNQVGEQNNSPLVHQLVAQNEAKNQLAKMGTNKTGSATQVNPAVQQNAQPTEPQPTLNPNSVTNAQNAISDNTAGFNTAGLKNLLFDPLKSGSDKIASDLTKVNPDSTLFQVGLAGQRAFNKARVSAQQLAKLAYKPLDRSLGFTKDKKQAITDYKAVASTTYDSMKDAAARGDRASYEFYKSEFNKSEGAIQKMTETAIDTDLTNARAELEYFVIVNRELPSLENQLNIAEQANQLQAQLIRTANGEVKEVIWNIVNSFLAGVLVFLGSLTNGNITRAGLIASGITSIGAGIVLFKEYWTTQKKEYTNYMFKFL